MRTCSGDRCTRRRRAGGCAAGRRAAEQAGGDRDERGDHRARPARRSRAESRRALHQDRARRRLRRHDVSSRDPPGHHPGRRSAVEGSGGDGALRHRRAESAEAGDQPREAHARRGVGGADSRIVPTAPARSSSSASPTSRRSTGSTRSLRASRKGSSSRRRSPRRAVDDKGAPVERIDDDEGDDSRQAGGDGRSRSRRRSVERAGALPRGARDVDGRHHDRVHAGQGAGARPQLPSTRIGRRLRRHELAPRGQRVRRPDRAHADATRAAQRGAAEVWCAI